MVICVKSSTNNGDKSFYFMEIKREIIIDKLIGLFVSLF